MMVAWCIIAALSSAAILAVGVPPAALGRECLVGREPPVGGNPRDGPGAGPRWRGRRGRRSWLAGRPAAPEKLLDRAADIALFAACLQAGLPVPQAVQAVAETTGAAPEWGRVAALCAVGADPAVAWEPLRQGGALGKVADLAQFSSHSGAAMADGCQRLAGELDAAAADASTAAAERAGVLIALPLAVCFLPAFFLLGLAPVVISLGADLLP